MRRVQPLISAVLHARPGQIAWRLRLIASRRIASRFAAQRRRALEHHAANLAPGSASGAAPSPFSPRTGMFHRDGGTIVLRFLNRELAFPGSIDWRVANDPGASHLWRFHLHYHEFLEEVGDDDFVAIVRDWIASNPPYAPGYWFDSWASYALSLRVVVWMQQLDRRRPRLPAGFAAELARSLREQILFLESNLELDLGGNHLIKNLKALLFASKCLGSESGARWRARASHLLARELREQIGDDGLHFEKSPAYHAQVFADLIECREVLEPGPLKDLLDDRLAAMAQALADTTHADGSPSLFGDGGLHMAYPAGQLLAAWERISGRATIARRAIRLDAAGFAGLRDGGDLLLVKVGRIAPDHLPAHGHGDILAFEWTVDGHRLAVDTGVFEYADGPRRATSRATASHNTVTVDGADQCEFFGSFRVGRRASVVVERLTVAEGALDLTASHDGFARRAGAGRHRRTVAGSARAFTIDDDVSGTRGRAEAWLILHPHAKAAIDGSRARIDCDGVAVELVASGPIEAAPWEWWPDFGVAIPTIRLRIDYGPLPARGRLAFAVVRRP